MIGLTKLKTHRAGVQSYGWHYVNHTETRTAEKYGYWSVILRHLTYA
jgi:hypothetical protein